MPHGWLTKKQSVVHHVPVMRSPCFFVGL